MGVVVNYAVEDQLSEEVVLRCFGETGVVPGIRLLRGGFGYLKSIAPGLNKTSAGIPYLMLTDLDAALCPSGLIDRWLGSHPRHPNFLFRVAVREVEAWVLADADSLSGYLGVARAVLPREFETLSDPKLELLKAARRSRYRRIREDIVFDSDYGPVQGPDYNGALARFVRERWEISAAAQRCPSLKKTLVRLEELRLRMAE